LEVTVRWDIFNGLFHRLARRSVPTVLVRYEDYVEDIGGTLRASLGLVGLECGGTPETMTRGHGIAGNPSRFADDGQAIMVDDRWITELGRIKHTLVSAATWRKRSAYGYRYRRSEPVVPLVRHATGRAAGTGDRVTGGVTDSDTEGGSGTGDDPAVRRSRDRSGVVDD
jgi:hypothetical protein